MSYLDDRAAFTRTKLLELAEGLSVYLDEDKERVLREDTCIYVVGSGGRGELLTHSDIDLFIARVGRSPSDVDAFQIRQAIARTLHRSGFPDPSQGGAFLKMHTATSLCEEMGTPADDAGNTFTARMLLLLESKPLVGGRAYDDLLRAIVQRYWQNADEHERDYQPFVLVNDIVRYWRILLLNYVAKNFEREKELGIDELKAERRLRSYKLRFSRCATCFSALAALLDVTAKGSVAKDDVFEIVKRSPIERMRSLASRNEAMEPKVGRLLRLYEGFLKTIDEPKDNLLSSFKNRDFSKARADEGRQFGDEMFELLLALGQAGRGRELFRHMVV